MRIIGFYWGIFGVMAIILFAVYRIFPMVAQMQSYSLNVMQWACLIIFTLYMAYAEGYKGFHRGFAPRVVQRAGYLRQHSHPFLTLTAPLFCMGYFHATRRRIITSFAVTAGIVLLVIGVSHVPQPWRGIIDVGVITGLLFGTGSIIFFTVQMLRDPSSIQTPLDLPAQNNT